METNHEGTKKTREKTRTRTRGKGAASHPDRHPQEYIEQIFKVNVNKNIKSNKVHIRRKEKARPGAQKNPQITSTKNENKVMEREEKVNSCEQAHEPIRSAW